MPVQGPEAFLHRSGRTGRAGKSGATIVMVDKNDTKTFSRILRESQTKIEMIGPPAPREVMQASAKTVLKRMQVVEPEVVKFFQPAAEKVIDSGNQAQVCVHFLSSSFKMNEIGKGITTQLPTLKHA